MTTHHYAEVGTLAVCGQLADGINHTTHSAPVVRSLAARSRPNVVGFIDVCPICFAAVANERQEATA